MSHLARSLRSNIKPTRASGSLYGSGTLDIPVGVLSVSITAAGGAGGTTYAYNPGQPYIAEVAWSSGRPYIPAYFDWTGGFSFSGSIGLTPTVIPRPTALGQTPSPSYSFAYSGRTCYALYSNGIGSVDGVGSPNVHVYEVAQQSYIAPSAGRPAIPAGWYWKAAGATQDGNFWSPNGFTAPNIIDPSTWSTQWDCDARLRTRPTGAGQTLPDGIVGLSKRGMTLQTLTGVASYYFAGQTALPAVAGQPYIAPSESGGPYTGDSATVTLNGVTETFVGGYYTTPAVSATRAMASTGAGQTLSYAVPASGSLSYVYEF